MNVKPIRRGDQDGYPYLVLEIDGQEATLWLDQRLPAYGLVYLGDEWEDRISATLPADPANGRFEEQEFAGATDDPEVLRQFKAFWSDVNGADFDKVVLRRGAEQK